MSHRQRFSTLLGLVVFLAAACASSAPATPAPSNVPATLVPSSSVEPFPSPSATPAGTPVPLSPALAVYSPAPAPASCSADRVYNLAATMAQVAAFTIDATLTPPGVPVINLQFEWVGPTAARWRFLPQNGTPNGFFVIGTKVWIWENDGNWGFSPNDGDRAGDLLHSFITTYVVSDRPNSEQAGKVVGSTCQYDIMGDGSAILTLDGAGRLLGITDSSEKLTVDYKTIPNLAPPTGD